MRINAPILLLQQLMVRKSEICRRRMDSANGKPIDQVRAGLNEIALVAGALPADQVGRLNREHRRPNQFHLSMVQALPDRLR